MRCFNRAPLSGKTSKMPYSPLGRQIANYVMVSASAMANGWASFKNCTTSCSWPAFALKVSNSPFVFGSAGGWEGSLLASTSIFWMCGAVSNKVSARCSKALATAPFRWAFRDSSSGKKSTMPYSDRPKRTANQAFVPASCRTNGRAEARKASTSSSLPCFASKRTSNPLVIVMAR